MVCQRYILNDENTRVLLHDGENLTNGFNNYEEGDERILEKGGFDFKSEERMGKGNFNIHIRYMWLMERNQM